MAQTFAQLGIPFPLFEGPSDQATRYCGLNTCSLCGDKPTHCFRLEIGCAVIIACPGCGTENGLDADDRADCPCRVCKQTVPFPELGENEIKACYACLQTGKAAMTKDTELGMISWEQAFEGVTHGLPCLNRDDFEMVPKDDDWVGTGFRRIQCSSYYGRRTTKPFKASAGNSVASNRWCSSVRGVIRSSRGVLRTATGDGTFAGSCKTVVLTFGIAKTMTLGSMSFAATRAEG